jgi:hypothetical protein
VSATSGPAVEVPVTQKREFWVLMGYKYFLARRKQAHAAVAKQTVPPNGRGGEA